METEMTKDENSILPKKSTKGIPSAVELITGIKR
jgi:hypothetical protein